MPKASGKKKPNKVDTKDCPPIVTLEEQSIILDTIRNLNKEHGITHRQVWAVLCRTTFIDKGRNYGP